MGYAVHVDQEALAAGAAHLGRTAETLGELAGRVARGCAAAAAAAGGEELGVVLGSAARTTAVSLGRGAAVVAALGTATAAAGTDYRLLEEGLTGRCGGRSPDRGGAS